MKKILLILLILQTTAYSQQIEWASNVSYDNEMCPKDGYRARLIIGPPDAELYGEWCKGAGGINVGKTASVWLDYKGVTATKQILILESNGAGSILKVELVDAVTGNSTPVYENPVTEIKANYRLTRIVLPDAAMKPKLLKIKLSAKKDKQQIDAVAITDSDEEFTIESILAKYSKVKVKFNNEGNDASLNNFTHQFNASTMNVLNVKKDISSITAGLKPGESGNLGSNVNSVYDEIAPIISPDEQTLYFIRSGHPENTMGWKSTGSEDIWFCNFNKKDQVWEKALHSGLPFNKDDYNKIVGITPDGNTVLIKGAYTNGEYKKRGFSFSYRTATGWTEPEQIKLKDYDNMAKGNYLGSYLPNNGKTLLLSFSEKTGSDFNDIYVSFVQENGSWSKPKNLGEQLNTKDGEDTPFLASDGVTLYFASNRPGGLGKRDIYMSTRLDDTWLNWSPPVNLGSTINTAGDDANYSIAASGYYAYMVSTRNAIGGSDVVRMKLKDEIKPNPVVLVSGKVLNSKTKQPIDASIMYQFLSDGGEAGIARSNPANGEYKIVLPYGKNYGFLAKASGFMAISDNLDLSTVSEFKEITRDLYLVPIEVGEIIRLNNIFFETAKSELKSESFPELDRVVKYMLDNTSLEIEISGHTDNVGSNETNLTLSDDRAKSVKNYIVSKGISETRILSKGYGETKPINTNDSEEGRKDNRRVEFSILKK